MCTTPLRLLLVDDDPAISSAILMLLKHYGHQAMLARSLAEAKKMPTPDVMVLDLMLPDGSGLELLEAIRTAGAPTRVIVLTGSTDAALERRVRRLTPEEVYHKPLNFLELLEGIRAQIEEVKQAA